MITVTVEPLLTHTPLWMARAMGYERLWEVMDYERLLLVQNNDLVPEKSMGYGILGVRVKRSLTVLAAMAASSAFR